MLETFPGTIAVGFSGSMGAGKSTLISKLKERWAEVDIISFGDYIRHQAALLGLEEERETLQNLGQSLYEEFGPELFVARVLDWAQPKTKIHLFDGVRHVQVWNAICQRHDKSALVFLELNSELQHQRLHERGAIELSGLHHSNSHPVESEKILLREWATLRLDVALPVDELITTINSHISKF